MFTIAVLIVVLPIALVVGIVIGITREIRRKKQDLYFSDWIDEEYPSRRRRKF